MRTLITASLFALAAAALALGPVDNPPLAGNLAGLSAGDAAALASVDDLRRAGPEALNALLDENDRHPGTVSPATIDAVAGQHDASWSRLFWYTDLQAARAQAKSQNKPILYLRLLGKLTDEYSCANSRFFRTVLYANTNVSALLRDRFILVWGTERPVPVITVDYGDGRVLKRTITGNSAHYVLDAQGNIVDVLPGLYDPVAFARILTAAAQAATSTIIESRRSYWQQSQATLASEWRRDTAAPTPAPSLFSPARPNADAAMPLAPSKGEVERPLVRAVLPPAARQVAAQPAPNAAAAAGQAKGKSMAEGPVIRRLSREFAEVLDARNTDDATWKEVANRHLADARLDASSIALIRSQNPTAYADAAALARVIEQFQRSIAADTVRNNYLFRAQILGWLQAAPSPLELEALNQRVYSELFLTPRTDPWLGLVPESTYTALTDDGCTTH
ncbi:MAG: hypothetical protein AABZ53_10180 [Planctomycetota bacterium]